MQPPLSTWDRAWRLVVVLVISGFAWFQIAVWQLEHRPAWFWADLAAGLVCLVLLRWRRSHPIAVNVVVNLASIGSASCGGPATLALVSLSTRRRWREIVPIAILSYVVAMIQIALLPLPQMWAISIPFVAAIIAVSVGWGLYIGSRRELVATLTDRAARAESEQAMRVSQARSSERARIAREMHDVMAHRISLVTMHAGALAYRDDLDPAQVKETAALIQKTSHQALAELREVLGVLRDDAGDAAPERPQPTACDLPGLVEEAVEAGMTIRFSQGIALDAVPETIGRTLYRVVQETLTNARKHAPGAVVTLSLTGGPGDGLVVLVQNPMPLGSPTAAPGGSGLGLVGLGERAALVGGRLHHRRATTGDFVVEGWFPWPT